MNDDPDEENRMIEETKEYYRQRAAQYSDWAHRTGDYEGDSEPDSSFFDEAKLLLDAWTRNGWLEMSSRSPVAQESGRRLW